MRVQRFACSRQRTDGSRQANETALSLFDGCPDTRPLQTQIEMAARQRTRGARGPEVPPVDAGSLPGQTRQTTSSWRYFTYSAPSMHSETLLFGKAIERLVVHRGGVNQVAGLAFTPAARSFFWMIGVYFFTLREQLPQRCARSWHPASRRLHFCERGADACATCGVLETAALLICGPCQPLQHPQWTPSRRDALCGRQAANRPYAQTTRRGAARSSMLCLRRASFRTSPALPEGANASSRK